MLARTTAIGLCLLSSVDAASGEIVVGRESGAGEDLFYRMNSATGHVQLLGTTTTRFAWMDANALGDIFIAEGNGAIHSLSLDAFGAAATGVSIAELRGISYNHTDDRFYAVTGVGASTREIFWFDPVTGVEGTRVQLGAFADASNGNIDNFYFDALGNPVISVVGEDDFGTLRTEIFSQVNLATGDGVQIGISQADPEDFTEINPFHVAANGDAWTLMDVAFVGRSFGTFAFGGGMNDSAFPGVFDSGGRPFGLHDATVLPSPGAALVVGGGLLILRRRR